MKGAVSDHAGAWYVTTEDSLVLHVSAAGRVRSVATLEDTGHQPPWIPATISPGGSTLFVADYNGHKILQVEAATGTVTTLAGSGEDGDTDAVGGTAQFYFPCGVAISPDGSALFVADFGGHKIRRGEVATGAVTTAAGSGTAGSADGVSGTAQFCYPSGVAISPDGSALFVADRNNQKIRRVEVATGAVTTIAGGGSMGSADGVGSAAQFANPCGVAISPDGSALFVADEMNTRSSGWR